MYIDEETRRVKSDVRMAFRIIGDRVPEYHGRALLFYRHAPAENQAELRPGPFVPVGTLPQPRALALGSEWQDDRGVFVGRVAQGLLQLA